jgi:hypothetical protein
MLSFIVEFLKSIFASAQAKKAAQAAAELPQGQAAITQIDADGKTIQAQLDAAKK